MQNTQNVFMVFDGNHYHHCSNSKYQQSKSAKNKTAQPKQSMEGGDKRQVYPSHRYLYLYLFLYSYL